MGPSFGAVFASSHCRTLPADAVPMTDAQDLNPRSDATESGHYTVIARRYRPQGFDELIGQQHVAQALSNAIASGRVGHAYLFTGARGVGKTSSARIFAKALNCVTGPTAHPCNQCDICRAISTGDDVDVLEIDGASNRGIEEIRQLRQNVNVRPSRARYKIYIIDEVHMLTREAFNALLKTLEEPPEHVKFIFCTTEPSKIPITILSRCQRFDFAGIRSDSIAERLATICHSEGVEADPEALRLLARRAAGSMRDSQSLLEQLLSFSAGKITAADVHAMLGIADFGRLAALLAAVADRNAAAAFAELDAAVAAGVDCGQLLEQLFGCFRDCMAAVVGCPAEQATAVPAEDWETIRRIGNALGIDGLTAAMQIIDHCLARMRLSTQGRALAELALVQLCRLDQLAAIEDVIARIEALPNTAAGAAASASMPGSPRMSESLRAPTAPRSAAEHGLVPSTVRPVGLMTPSRGDSGREGGEEGDRRDSSGAATANRSSRFTGETASRTAAAGTVDASPGHVPADAQSLWGAIAARATGLKADQAKLAHRVEFEGNDRLVVYFSTDHILAKNICEQAETLAGFRESAREILGRPVQIEIRMQRSAAVDAPKEASAVVSPQRRLYELADHPLVAAAEKLFGATPVRWDPAKSADKGRKSETEPSDADFGEPAP